VGQIQKVLQNLLRERVSIRSLATILEALADAAPSTLRSEQLTEFVRQRLARQLTSQHLGRDDKRVLPDTAPALEQTLSDGSAGRTRARRSSSIRTTQQRLCELMRRQGERVVAMGHRRLSLCDRVRSIFQQIVVRSVPSLVSLSYAKFLRASRWKCWHGELE